MKVYSINLIKNSYHTKYQNGSRYNKLRLLPYDTVSFGAMKKSGFEGIDLLVVNKFKAPIEKFNNNEDFQKWCSDKIKELKNRDLEGRSEETIIQRRATFKEWVDYIEHENDAYTNSMELLMLDGILKGVDKNNDMEIPPLNKRALADTIEKISLTNCDVNFNKEYRLTLQNMSLNNLKTHINNDKTGWVVIPSFENDPKHFEENVDKLKTLSHKNWCTASFNARPYLEEGDFHVYLEKGHPKLGVRFDKDKIAEIQGEKNNSRIPIKYLDIVKEHTKDYGMYMPAHKEFEQAEIVKQKIEKIENKLKKQGVDFKTCSAHQLFEVLNIEHEVDENGMVILEEYLGYNDDFTFEDIGISEDRLFKEIKEIKGDADFKCSHATNLGNLQKIKGYADFSSSKLTTLGNLESIGGYAEFWHSSIKDLGKLKYIGGNAFFNMSEIETLGNLESIGGNAFFNNSKVINLGNLKKVGDYICVRGSKLKFDDFIDIDSKNLEKLKKALNKLKEQGVDFASCSASQLFDAFDIKYKVDKDGLLILDEYKQPDSQFTFYYLGVDENKLFKEIKEIKGDADFQYSHITNLGNLQRIMGDADFRNSEIEDLSNLRYIGKNADFRFSKVKSLGKLKTITGYYRIAGSSLTKKDFKNIASRGGMFKV